MLITRFCCQRPIFKLLLLLPSSAIRAEGARGNPGDRVPPEHDGGADRDRTDDLRLAKPPLSQLSYSPDSRHRWRRASDVSEPSSMVGLDRFELSTPRLSSVCSNQLSYRPSEKGGEKEGRPDSKEPSGSLETEQRRVYEILRRPQDCRAKRRECLSIPRSLRKEVIQPQVLLQLPCYDFTPITDHTLSGCVPCGFAHRFLVQPTFVM